LSPPDVALVLRWQPSPSSFPKNPFVTIPSQKTDAQAGLALIKSAMLAYLAQHPEGVSNLAVADALGLVSTFEGENKNYLTWSVFGLLVNEGKVRYEIRSRRRVYFLAD
jgi:uncharacterized protein